jgi:hypothetical protein
MVVNVIKEANKIFKELGYNPEDFEIKMVKRRVKYPDIVFNNEKSKKGDLPLLSIFGNEPSLIRFALGYIISHELAHYEYRKLYGYNPDEDFLPEFKEIERDLIEKFWDVCMASDCEIN